MENTEPKKASRWALRLELWSTILLAVGTVMLAWCAYQSSLWNGVQTFRLSESNSAGRIAEDKLIMSHQDRMVHINLFMSYLEAKGEGNDELAAFYQQRFPNELKKAHDAWMTTDPLADLSAPSHPFAMSEYESRLYKEAAQQSIIAKQKMDEAYHANKVSDSYVLCTVLFASVLFFAGVSTRFALYKIRLTLFIFGCIMFIIAIISMGHLPISTEWSL